VGHQTLAGGRPTRFSGGRAGCSHRIFQAAEMQENFRLPLVFQKSRQPTVYSSNAEDPLAGSGEKEVENPGPTLA
jgi:hypothetical protein